MKFDHRSIEKKWQRRWEEERVFEVQNLRAARKAYVLDMFPYPSAAGLHVGHPKGYTATDVVARKLRMDGVAVLHPMGWDAFGLPTENFAIKVGKNPKEIAVENINNFRRQVKSLGLSYDWSREISTADPEYYRWTQWLFLRLYEKGLAYKEKAPVNWCPKDNTVLANEQVVNGACERCWTAVERRELEQWFFRITKYADRLLAGLSGIDWPERITSMQRNWIGRSEGVEVNFRGRRQAAATKARGAKMKIKNGEFDIPVFTTRADTLWGVTAVVLSPEHPLVDELVSTAERKAVDAYRQAVRNKSERERVGTERDKTGLHLGAAVVHPLTGGKLPVWIAEYVLMGYGTGAVMLVPAHDDRDFAFAKRYGLDAKYVVAPPHEVSEERHEERHHGRKGEEEGRKKGKKEVAYTGDGILVNSGEFSGLTSADARQKIADALESSGRGRRQTNYHLRDWLVSRQRYWGAPIPIIYCRKCGQVPVPEKDLPVLLPDDVDFRPSGESPLARSKLFHRVSCPKCGAAARRESDTMDTFVDSSWYFLRYTSPRERNRPFDPEAVTAWCPVDVYVGGAEHAVLHLLYARFITMVLEDLGYLNFSEPFLRLQSVGLVLGEDGAKMSKSRGNVINPDEVVEEYGADTMRLFEMFGGEFSETLQWSTKGIVGVRRFLERVAALGDRVGEKATPAPAAETLRLLHQTIKKVTADISAFKFNTAISAMMILANHLAAQASVDLHAYETLLKLLHPFAPHLTEELWERRGHKGLIAREKWSAFEAALAREEEMTIVVQVDGKVRDTLSLPAGASEDEVRAAALASPKVKKWLDGKKPQTIRYIPGRIVSIVPG